MWNLSRVSFWGYVKGLKALPAMQYVWFENFVPVAYTIPLEPYNGCGAGTASAAAYARIPLDRREEFSAFFLPRNNHFT